MSDASHASGAHESHSAHAHDVYEGTPADTIPPDEPHTPGWLPIVGIGLALGAILIFALRHEDTASAASGGIWLGRRRGRAGPGERPVTASLRRLPRDPRVRPHASSGLPGHPFRLHAPPSRLLGGALCSRECALLARLPEAPGAPGPRPVRRPPARGRPRRARPLTFPRGDARKVVAFSAIVWQSLRHLRGCSSVGRALAWHARGQGFDSPQLHPKYSKRKPAPERAFSFRAADRARANPARAGPSTTRSAHPELGAVRDSAASHAPSPTRTLRPRPMRRRPPRNRGSDSAADRPRERYFR